MTENRPLPLRLNLFPSLLLAAVLLGGSAFAQNAGDAFAGNYVRDNPENDWHTVTIESGTDGTLHWKNAAGKSWTLAIGNNGNELRSGNDCPYGEQEIKILKDRTGKLIRLQFNNEIYRRHWKYGDEEDWPYMGDPNVQSPVEVPEKGGENPQLPGSYSPMKVMDVKNNGHAFQLDYGPDGGGKIETGPQLFKLVQFHFHSPSEHKQTGYAGWTDENGKNYPGHYAMEVHFVHADGTFEGDGKTAQLRQDLAVVGVFIKEGAPNAELQRIWDECPDAEGTNPNPSFGLDASNPSFGKFDASKLMPQGSNYQTYRGSLTTPPLSSGVTWYVMDQPIEASADQINYLREAMKHNTNRSIQISPR